MYILYDFYETCDTENMKSAVPLRNWQIVDSNITMVTTTSVSLHFKLKW